VAQTIQADLKSCGITDKLVPVSQGDYYGKYLENPDAAKRGVWDISEPGWVPDWYGNNGRAIIEPLFDGRTYGPGSTDWGDYNNAAVNTDIDQALATTDQTTAGNALHAADQQIMTDAAIIPFQTQSTPLMRSTRVHNAIYWPFAVQFDYTNVWLNPTS
jgi:peptide/nickel transport system substrate-binding protein